MKRLFCLLLLLFASMAASAQGYITPSQIMPYDGFVRKSPCQSGAGDNCGSEPATWHITPDQCGLLFSTSSARDEQYTYARESGNGVKTQFEIPFPYLNTSHLQVLVGSVLKTEGVDYTVSAPGNSGTVTFVTPPASGLVTVRVRTAWDGDGATVDFPFNFPVKYINSLQVKVGASTKAYGTDYTIAGLGSSTGGTVTFVVAPAAGTGNVTIGFKTDGTTRGNRFTFPTVAELTAAGYTAGGASPNDARGNREGQCTLSFIPAAPAPFNYLRIAMPDDAIRGVDKFTMIEGGASFDASSGDLVVPIGWGIHRWRYNGVSWLYDGNHSNADRLGMGSPHAHGQGRLFLVTADPSWWTVTTRVGSLAWCPVGGRGITANANDHPTLLLSAVNCAYEDGSGSATEFIQVKSINGIQLGGVSEGAAYVAGTAPNGQNYPAGKYVKLSLSGLDGGALTTGDTLTVWNAATVNDSRANGKWIVQVISKTLKCDGVSSGACVELHEEVWDWDSTVLNKNGIGPPSSFVTGDTHREFPVWSAATTYAKDALVSHNGVFFKSLQNGNLNNATTDTNWWAANTLPCCTATAIQTASSGSGRITDPVNGVEYNAVLQDSAVVGIAKQVASVWTSSGSKQNVAGMYNPVERRCSFSPSADKNITSTTDVEVDNTVNCEFAYMNGTSKVAMDRGDQGRRVRYQVSATVSADTAGIGCQLNITFDNGAVEEAAPPVFVNPTGVTGGKFNISFAGNKAGLTEGIHVARLVAKRIGGSGNCTIHKDNTVTSVWIMQ